jgi:hypothetical protein
MQCRSSGSGYSRQRIMQWHSALSETLLIQSTRPRTEEETLTEYMCRYYIANNSLVLGERPLEQPKWGYSRQWSGMGQACHGEAVDYNQPSLVVAVRTSDRLGAVGSRATSLAEVGKESIDRREGDK